MDPPVEQPAEVPYEETQAVPAAPVGRTERRRRRRRDRWKKHQRRAVVDTAVALVGGGLTVASLDRRSEDRAATARDTTATGAGEEQITEPAPAASRPASTYRSRPDTPSARPTATSN